MDIKFRGSEQLRALARDFKAAGDEGKGLRKELRRAITESVRPMRDSVRRAILSIPATGTRHTGLRAEMAKATRIRTGLSARNASVRLEVAASRMPEGKQALPALMDGSSRWRHPVFGNRKNWVTQTSHPFFWPAIAPHIKDVRAAVTAAVDRITAKLEKKEI